MPRVSTGCENRLMVDAGSCSLYVLWNADHEVIYVGITTQRMNRMVRHAHVATWWHEVAQATFVHFGARSEAVEAERRAIRELRPCYNVQLNRPLRDEKAQMQSDVADLRRLERELASQPEPVVALGRHTRAAAEPMQSGPYKRPPIG